jgi:hypothetical protein
MVTPNKFLPVSDQDIQKKKHDNRVVCRVHTTWNAHETHCSHTRRNLSAFVTALFLIAVSLSACFCAFTADNRRRKSATTAVSSITSSANHGWASAAVAVMRSSGTYLNSLLIKSANRRRKHRRAGRCTTKNLMKETTHSGHYYPALVTRTLHWLNAASRRRPFD